MHFTEMMLNIKSLEHESKEFRNSLNETSALLSALSPSPSHPPSPTIYWMKTEKDNKAQMAHKSDSRTTNHELRIH